MSKDAGTLESVEQPEDVEEGDGWMSRLLNSELLTRLPPHHIAQFFAELEPVSVGPGQSVVEQGSPGDFLYIVAEGRFEVARKLPGGLKEQQLAVLHGGAVFGEEALIADLPRNATVRAIRDGLVMRLGKNSFGELVSLETLRPVPYAEGCALVENGATWLDVRFAEEVDNVALPGSTNIPLNQLRLRFSELDRSSVYVAYCDTGGRGSTAAYLLTRERFDVYFLAGGIAHTPLAEGMSSTGGDAQAPQELAPEELDRGRLPADFELEVEPANEADATPSPPPKVVPREAPVAPPQPVVVELPLAVPDGQLQTALTQLKSERERHELALGKWREQMRALKGDRDAIAAKCEKAIHVARDFKTKVEATACELKAERARAEATRVDEEAKRGELARTLNMERSRLDSELDALNGRFKNLLGEHEVVQSQRAQERAELQAALDEARVKSRELNDELTALSATAEHLRGQLETDAQAHREELETVLAKVLVLETENDTARARVDVLETRFEALRKTILVQESQLAEASSTDTSELDLERAEVERAREVVSVARASMDSERVEAERQRAEGAVRLKGERDELAQRQASLEARAKSVDQRLSALDEELSESRAQHADSQARGRLELDTAREQFAHEKSAWDERIERAIQEERVRLNSAQESLAREVGVLEASRDTFAAQMEARSQEIAAEQSEVAVRLKQAERALEAAEETRSAAELELVAREQDLARRLAALSEREATLATAAATEISALAELDVAHRSVTEQAALFAEKERRFENEIVQLREALAAHTPQAAQPSPVPPVVLEADLSMEFDIESDLETFDSDADFEPAPLAPPVEAAETPAVALAIDEDFLAESEPFVPANLPGEGDGTRPDRGKRDDAESQRVISPNQLAAIRARMKEKMASVR